MEEAKYMIIQTEEIRGHLITGCWKIGEMFFTLEKAKEEKSRFNISGNKYIIIPFWN